MTAIAAVTGLGVVAPNGVGTEAFWRAVLRGESGIRPITRFDASSYPVQSAGEVPDISAVEAEIPGRLRPQTDRVTRMALAAASWTLADAGLDPSALDSSDMGVFTAICAGGYEFGQRELQNLWGSGADHVSAYQSFAWFYAVNTGQISIRHGIRGPSGTVVTEQAGGLDALALARRAVHKGTPVVLSGAMDSALCPWGWVAYLSTGQMAAGAGPEHAYLPFAEGARGHLPGEGGALLLLEDAARAYQRTGARVYGEVAGHASSFDPPADSGRPSTLVKAMRAALDDAGLSPHEVDAVFADASGAPDRDRAEAEALVEMFGEHAVPVAAPKATTGRIGAGGAALDVATALLSLRDQVLPPAGPVPRAAEDYAIDLVTGGPRATRLRVVMVLARGHGGFNSALVLRAPRTAAA